MTIFDANGQPLDLQRGFAEALAQVGGQVARQRLLQGVHVDPRANGHG